MTNVESRKNDRTRIPKNKVIGAPIDYSSFGFLSTFGFRHWVHPFVILQIRDKLPRGIRLVWQKLHHHTDDPAANQPQTDVLLAGGVDPPAGRGAGGNGVLFVAPGQTAGRTGGARTGGGGSRAVGARTRPASENGGRWVRGIKSAT